MLKTWAAILDDGELLDVHMSTPDHAHQSPGYPNHAAQAFMAHALAGAAAGMAETAVMYPVDTIKTRLQVIFKPAPCKSPTFVPGLYVMHAKECIPHICKLWLSDVWFSLHLHTKIAQALQVFHAVSVHTALQAASGVGSAGHTAQIMRQLIHGQGLTGLYRGLTPAVLGAGPAHALYYAVYEQTKAALGAGQPGRRPATVAAAGASLDAAGLTASMNNRRQAHTWPSIFMPLMAGLHDVSRCGSPFCRCEFPQNGL